MQLTPFGRSGFLRRPHQSHFNGVESVDHRLARSPIFAVTERKLSKPERGHLAKHSISPHRHLHEFRGAFELAAGDAAGIPLAERDLALDADVSEIARLAELKKNAEVIVYPGADHGFFCNERESYRADAAKDAASAAGARSL